MAERMTRDEHIDRAEKLLTAAEEILLHATVSGGESNASDLIAAAQVHATLAVALAEPVVVASAPASPLRQMFGGQFGDVT